MAKIENIKLTIGTLLSNNSPIIHFHSHFLPFRHIFFIVSIINIIFLNNYFAFKKT